MAIRGMMLAVAMVLLLLAVASSVEGRRGGGSSGRQCEQLESQLRSCRAITPVPQRCCRMAEQYDQRCSERRSRSLYFTRLTRESDIGREILEKCREQEQRREREQGQGGDRRDAFEGDFEEGGFEDVPFYRGWF